MLSELEKTLLDSLSAQDDELEKLQSEVRELQKSLIRVQQECSNECSSLRSILRIQKDNQAFLNQSLQQCLKVLNDLQQR